jgi:small subunit ribosomal protein S1
LKPDAVIPGVVTRLEPYGVFIDIGTGRDGMVHISELTDGYISAPSEVLSVGDKIDVKVLEVDRKARKVNLSTKDFITVSKVPEPVKEDQSGQAEPAPTLMELAFQAASKREEDSKVIGLKRLVAKKASRR